MAFWVGVGLLAAGFVAEFAGAPISTALLLIGCGMVVYQLLLVGKL